VLDAYAAAGATRTILRLPSAEREVVLPLLDEWTKFLK
jgi:hypothetical protein